MKNKILSLAILASSLFSMTGCLDMEPVSSTTDENMWQNEGQFTSFVYGVHSRLRDHSFNMFILGELRADIYSVENNGWSGESNDAQLFSANLLTKEKGRTGLTNFAGFYSNINQISLFIEKAKNSDIVTESNKGYYLGQMYGLRAFYYFHLLRSWGDVVWSDQPSMGFEVGKLEKAASPATEIMQHIKDDINLSEQSYGDDYSFREGKTFWSKAATLMLKAEVYLWSSQQMNGGTGDATTAKNALTEIQTKIDRSKLDLLSNFGEIFDYNHKGNNEIIFAIHNKQNETNLFNGKWRDNMVPQKTILNSYYDMEAGTSFNLNMNGTIHYPLDIDIYSQYDATDTRQQATLKAVYEAAGTHDYKGCFAYKYQGTTPSGASERLMADDYPIYRYADLLLLLAEAKSLLSEDPTNEINLIRERAYGDNYDAATIGYPHLGGDNDGIKEVLLRERFKEFMFEGKRWYDLRRFGNEYVYKYTTVDKQLQGRLLWPIDSDTMTDNPALNQTKDY
ncbi:SusD family outer membrane lipoprotein NanU [Bacteroides congonensis]|uniref:SusD family outer membrane lipoprotein NanU n=1 Tax=Bacteroides congonensis TaxID=1871006 RepID=UPI002675C1ED|nr:SusD family outer membrane lipoprotein NanU [Bacteroides congonensis]